MNIQAAVLAFFRKRFNSPRLAKKALFATRTGDKCKMYTGGDAEKAVGDHKKEEWKPHDFADPEQYQGQRNDDGKHSQAEVPGPANPYQSRI